MALFCGALGASLTTAAKKQNAQLPPITNWTKLSSIVYKTKEFIRDPSRPSTDLAFSMSITESGASR